MSQTELTWNTHTLAECVDVRSPTMPDDLPDDQKGDDVSMRGVWGLLNGKVQTRPHACGVLT